MHEVDAVTLLRYSRHAVERMAEQGISRGMVEAAVAAPETVSEGDTADEYTARVAGRRMRVVVARNRWPTLVITVYWIVNQEA